MKVITKRLKFSDLNLKPIIIEKFNALNKNPSRENAQEIYRVMLNTYKGAWLNRFGMTDEGIWSNVFARITMKQINRGFDVLAKLIKDSESKFRLKPPDAWEFLDMCCPSANEDFFEKQNKNKSRNYGWRKIKNERTESIKNT